MVIHQLQVKCGPEKVRRSVTDVPSITELQHHSSHGRTQQFTLPIRQLKNIFKKHLKNYFHNAIGPISGGISVQSVASTRH